MPALRKVDAKPAVEKAGDHEEAQPASLQRELSFNFPKPPSGLKASIPASISEEPASLPTPASPSDDDAAGTAASDPRPASATAPAKPPQPPNPAPPPLRKPVAPPPPPPPKPSVPAPAPAQSPLPPKPAPPPPPVQPSPGLPAPEAAAGSALPSQPLTPEPSLTSQQQAASDLLMRAASLARSARSPQAPAPPTAAPVGEPTVPQAARQLEAVLAHVHSVIAEVDDLRRRHDQDVHARSPASSPRDPVDTHPHAWDMRGAAGLDASRMPGPSPRHSPMRQNSGMPAFESAGTASAWAALLVYGRIIVFRGQARSVCTDWQQAHALAFHDSVQLWSAAPLDK